MSMLPKAIQSEFGRRADLGINLKIEAPGMRQTDNLTISILKSHAETKPYEGQRVKGAKRREPVTPLTR